MAGGSNNGGSVTQIQVIVPRFYGSRTVMIPVSNGTINRTTLQRFIPGASALTYQKNGINHFVNFDEKRNLFTPPPGGWNQRQFCIVFDKSTQSSFWNFTHFAWAFVLFVVIGFIIFHTTNSEKDLSAWSGALSAWALFTAILCFFLAALATLDDYLNEMLNDVREIRHSISEIKDAMD